MHRELIVIHGPYNLLLPTKFPQLYELLAGDSLFDPYFQTHELGLSSDESHLIQIIELLGAFPADVLRVGEYSERWFKKDGEIDYHCSTSSRI